MSDRFSCPPDAPHFQNYAFDPMLKKNTSKAQALATGIAHNDGQTMLPSHSLRSLLRARLLPIFEILLKDPDGF